MDQGQSFEIVKTAFDVLGPIGAFLVAFVMTFNRGMLIMERLINVYSERTSVYRELGNSVLKLAESLNNFSEKTNEDDKIKMIISQVFEQIKDKENGKKKVA